MQQWLKNSPYLIPITVFILFIGMVIILRWPSTWSWLPKLKGIVYGVASDDRHTMIQVHATIVAIFFGAVWVFASNLIATIEQLEEKAFLEAKKIRPPWQGVKLGGDNQAYMAKDPEGRMQVATRWGQLTVNDAAGRVLYNNPAERGRDVLRIMSALAAIPPLGGPAPASLDGMREWVREAGPLAQMLRWAWERPGNQLDVILEAYHQEDLEGYRRRHQADLEQQHSKLLLSHSPKEVDELMGRSSRSRELALSSSLELTSKTHRHYSEIVRQFYLHLLHTSQLAQSLDSVLQDIEAFKSRRAAKSKTSIYLWVMAVAFICGVLLPLVWTQVGMLFILLIPAVYYIFLFISLLQQIP
jgi:hypothetical protein